jgi:hypothetical protein
MLIANCIAAFGSRILAILLILSKVIPHAPIGHLCRPSVTYIQNTQNPFVNSLFVISPYRYQGMWVFDDPTVGLVREPFVFGIDLMIDRLVAGIPNAHEGFGLIFSPTPFPGYTVKLGWRRSEYGGNWYYSPDYQMEGWLCPALFKYFPEAPKELYARAEKK